MVEGANDRGIWAGTTQGQTLVTLTGNPAAGVPGAHYESLNSVWVNASQQVAFTGTLGPNSVWGGGSALWAGPQGKPRLVLRPGDPAPAGGGVGAGEKFDGASGAGTFINDAGQITFGARLRGANLPADGYGQSIWPCG